MRTNKICPHCSWSNPYDAIYCGNCQKKVARLIDAEGKEGSASITTRNNPALAWSTQLNYGDELKKITEQFIQERKLRDKSGLLYMLFFRHVEAARLQSKMDLTYDRIEDAWLNAYAEIHENRAQAVVELDRQILSILIAQMGESEVLKAKIDRDREALMYVDETYVKSGFLDDWDEELKRFVLTKLVEHIDDEVFGSNEDQQTAPDIDDTLT